ncbi:MAG TPA: hypothetical protein PLW67_11365, partial [Prolixibacteraceae bacterium]|nr:hypothetical protein [Prolixibacteraceae bacterium]
CSTGGAAVWSENRTCNQPNAAPEVRQYGRKTAHATSQMQHRRCGSMVGKGTSIDPSTVD